VTTGAVQLQTALPDESAARRLAAAVVGERLAACVQVVGPVRSTYRWEGRVQEAEEWLCLIKTTTARVPDLIPRLRALHPYEVPEIIALPIIDGDPDYLRWVESAVS